MISTILSPISIFTYIPDAPKPNRAKISAAQENLLFNFN